MKTNKTDHIIELSKSIIDSIELSNNDSESILLKCTRLARYIDDEETREWLNLEQNGYRNKSKNRSEFLDKTNRWTDKEKTKFLPLSIGEIEATIVSQENKVKTIRIPDPSGEWGNIAVQTVVRNLNSATETIGRYKGIRSRVIHLAHEFATKVYYENVFEGLATSIFENYKDNIDGLISESSGDTIEKIPYVITQLRNKEPESISQALTTCRRIIDKFADAIFPAQDEPIEMGGNLVTLKEDKILNRINAFIHKNTESKGRKIRLRQNLTNLYERVSKGVHSDVDFEEAENLFFNVYLVIGEILTMKK